MGKRGPLPNPRREYLLALFARGELASLAEGAEVAGVSRVTVLKWLRSRQVNWKKQRQLWLARHGAIANARADGRAQKRLTKAEKREIAARAKREWDLRHGKDELGKAKE